jgi:hypothetical protein
MVYWGTWWCSWLRHWATSRKVAGPIPDGVTGIFHWHKPFGHTMALELTQSLTEMSTRNISWGWRRPVRRADNRTTFICCLSWNLGASSSWNPQGLSRPVMGLLYLYHGVLCLACSDILLSYTGYASTHCWSQSRCKGKQFSNMCHLCLLTVCGLFTHSKTIFGVPGFPLEMENHVKSLLVLTYWIHPQSVVCCHKGMCLECGRAGWNL